MLKHKKIRWTKKNDFDIENIITPNEKVIFNKKLGEGAFSNVLLANFTDWNGTNSEVAVKVEKNNKKHLLKYEYKIYKMLDGINGIPIIYGFISGNNKNFMIMEKMDKSLTDIINKKHKFKIQDVIKIMIWALQIIKKIHKAGYIHRDIKPSNFMIKNKKLKIIDFGLAKKHAIKNKKYKNGHIVGTLRYCSVNSHFYTELSYRDDLESLGYTIIYFIKGYLPWQKIKKPFNGSELIEPIKYLNHHIRNKKISIKLEDLCRGIPQIIKYYFQEIRKLKFGEMINYEKIIYKFKNYLQYIKKNESDNNINYNRISYHLKYSNE